MTKTIVTHESTFHADDSLACFFLLHTEEFKGSNIIRTRDPELISKADVVVDVGQIYDHEKRRYDHHQSSFTEKFPGCDIPFAACGIVYFHFGKEVITNLLKENNRDAGEYLDYLYEYMYKHFVKEVDANDNGVDQFPSDVKTLYTINTNISARIARMNPNWRETDADIFQRFLQAIDLIGKEFTDILLYTFDNQIPAINIVKKAYANRYDVDESGQILILDEPCPYSGHLDRLENENKDKPQVLYVISKRDDGSYNIKALGTGKGFELRKPLPFAGLRDDELSEKSGIPGGVFVHKTGFIGAFKEKEQAIQFAKLALAQDIPENPRVIKDNK